MKRKIYDCFSFYNELDLLEIRLTELFDKVDYFVIAEANVTYANNPRSYYVLDNWERFKPWKDKIRHIKVEDMPGAPEETRVNPFTWQQETFKNMWYNERHQRNCITRGLTDADGSDVLFINDTDEISRASTIDIIRNDETHNLWGLRCPIFNYKFNYMQTRPLVFQVFGQAFTVDRSKTFPTLSYSRETYGGCWNSRTKIYSDGTEMCIPHSGWHFSSLGDEKHVANKFKNYAHDELAWTVENLNIDQLISESRQNQNPIEKSKFEPVILDDYFPKAVTDNKEKYKHFILENATETVMDKLKIIDMNSSQEYSY